MLNAAIGGTLSVGGAASLNGGGTFTGTISGDHTYSGDLTLSGAGTGLSVGPSGGNQLTFTGGSAVSTPGTISTTNASKGFNIATPLTLNRNVAYSGLFNDPNNEWPFYAGATITGTSSNASAYATGLIKRTWGSTAVTGQATYGLQVWDSEGASSLIRSTNPFYAAGTLDGTPATPSAWAGNTAYSLGQVALNNKQVYQVITAGTSASSGGPTGTGSNITDGTVHWEWLQNLSHWGTMVVINGLGQENFNYGGASGTNPIGQVWGATIGSFLNCAVPAGAQCATGFREAHAAEFDDTVASGASVDDDITVQIEKLGGQGAFEDNALSIAGNGSSVWINPLIFEAATDPNGVAILFQDQRVGGLQTMAGAIDLSMVNANGTYKNGGGYLVRWSNGQIANSGDVVVGALGVHIISGGTTLDTTYSQLTGTPVVATAGTNWADGMWAEDQNGNYVTVTTDGSGHVTFVTVQVRDWVPTASIPGGAVTFKAIHPSQAFTTTTSGSAVWPTDFTATESYTSPTGINIGTGSATLISLGGAQANVLMGSGSPLATNATIGFPLVPSSAGPPTGTVAGAGTGKVAIEIDTTNKKLCYSTGGGTWECSAAFTP